ncbi:DUF502 domain-containing protein [Legionella waltersii]|uniref:Transmembrane protein n=1 Tax=Legionella waltersii TaxID=66969 RepID=A0A0W1A188_9GAMM|nr:DUF502 domain-containing protein [Legionella waltersii]KTD75118.1 transmembrane protein [Legionella waltersii]SNV04991.1 transmembrane protein [Legionella waltersii]
MKSKSIKAYLLTGLVVWLPILVTIGVVRFIVDLLDGIFRLFPNAYRPENIFGTYIPGLGVILSLLLLFATGLLATNFFGQRLVSWGESILAKIPLVRSIYNAVKQVIHAVFSTNSQAFRKALLVEYPRKGIWSVGFQTGTTVEEINEKSKQDMISIFIPTTPNPTSGFLMMVPKKDAIELSMSIDEALKLIISLGVMQPSSTKAIETTN